MFLELFVCFKKSHIPPCWFSIWYSFQFSLPCLLPYYIFNQRCTFRAFFPSFDVMDGFEILLVLHWVWTCNQVMLHFTGSSCKIFWIWQWGGRVGECQKGNTKAVDSSRAFRVLQGQSWRSGVMLPGNLS